MRARVREKLTYTVKIRVQHPGAIRLEVNERFQLKVKYCVL
jgi:hypothetical protein